MKAKTQHEFNILDKNKDGVVDAQEFLGDYYENEEQPIQERSILNSQPPDSQHSQHPKKLRASRGFKNLSTIDIDSILNISDEDEYISNIEMQITSM